jgi:HprK-related kinase B
MEAETKTLNDRAGEYMAAHTPLITLDLSFEGVIIRCRSNCRDLMDRLRHYFNHFVSTDVSEPHFRVEAIETEPHSIDLPLQIKKPDPGKHKIKEEYIDVPGGRIVRKRLTGMLFLFGGGINMAVGPCVANYNQVINFINNRFMQWHLNRGYILGHAAAVRAGEYGLALAGFSGAGKSTLSLHLMNRGTTFISNDRLLVRRSGDSLAMRGVAKLPRVNPGTLMNNPRLKEIIPDQERSEFERLSQDELWDLEHKYDVFVDQVFGTGKMALGAPMNGLVILNWNRSGEKMEIKKVDIADRRDLLPAFIKSPGLFYEPEDVEPKSAFSPEVYVRHLDLCEVYEVTGGIDFDQAADACLSLMER